jgi:hypothetical protein
MTLIEKEKDVWEIKSQSEIITGEFKTIVAYLNQKYNVPFEEIEIAISDMVQNDNNKAEFGDLNKTFMYSFK